MSYYESPKKPVCSDGSPEPNSPITGANNASHAIHKYFMSPKKTTKNISRINSPGYSPEKIRRALSPKKSPKTLESPTRRHRHQHHPEYHFFSPKHNQHEHKHREDCKPKHRRKLSLEKREECYEFMKYVQFLSLETGNRVLLPPKTDNKPTLVLDLDETLVHCSTIQQKGADFSFPADFNGTRYHISGSKRPNLQYFLQHVARDWEVVIFTASTSVYASQVVKILDPNGIFIDHSLFREACTNVEGNYIKDLACLGRDLRRTVIVDNSPQVFSLQIENGIPIESWYKSESDQELNTLLQILNELLREEDMRQYIAEEFEVQKHLDTLE